MLTRDDLAAAVRANDQVMDAGGNLPAILQTLHVEPQAAVYLAEQRALRVALFQSGVTPAQLRALAMGDPVAVSRLHKRQRDLIPTYAGVWIDGLAAALRADHAARTA